MTAYAQVAIGVAKFVYEKYQERQNQAPDATAIADRIIREVISGVRDVVAEELRREALRQLEARVDAFIGGFNEFVNATNSSEGSLERLIESGFPILTELESLDLDGFPLYMILIPTRAVAMAEVKRFPGKNQDVNIARMFERSINHSNRVRDILREHTEKRFYGFRWVGGGPGTGEFYQYEYFFIDDDGQHVRGIIEEPTPPEARREYRRIIDVRIRADVKALNEFVALLQGSRFGEAHLLAYFDVNLFRE